VDGAPEDEADAGGALEGEVDEDETEEALIWNNVIVINQPGCWPLYWYHHRVWCQYGILTTSVGCDISLQILVPYVE
jgi:hypothetical protein